MPNVHVADGEGGSARSRSCEESVRRRAKKGGGEGKEGKSGKTLPGWRRLTTANRPIQEIEAIQQETREMQARLEQEKKDMAKLKTAANLAAQVRHLSWGNICY